MDKLITVRKSQVQALVAFYEGEQAKLMEVIKETQSKLDSLKQQFREGQQTIIELTGTDDETTNNHIQYKSLFSFPDEYPASGSWWERIKWILNDKKMILSANEISEIIYSLQPDLEDSTAEERKKNHINIHSTLTNKNKLGELARIEDGEYRYGLNNWFDENDNLISKYDNPAR